MSIKRQLSSNVTINDDIKKIPKTSIEETNSLPINRFENLSNEIYYEIFDYLDGYSIHKAFSYLNNRFQRLITSSSFLLKISVDQESEIDMKDCCKYIINRNTHRILSLHLWNITYVQDFLQHCVIDSSFCRLQSIILYGTLASELQFILSSLKRLANLTSLACNVEDNASKITEIYQMIFQLPSLKYISLSIMTNNEINISKLADITVQSSSLETMIISHKCTIPELTSILGHTPSLKHLTCQMLIEPDGNIESNIQLTLPNLTHMTIDYCSMEFFELQKLIRKFTSPIRMLHISSFDSENYTDPNCWKGLILQNMPHLRKFIVQCGMIVDDNFQYDHLDSFIRQFTSQFWLERRWTFEFHISNNAMSYLICPQRKMQLNTFDQNACEDLVQQSNHFIKLSMTNHSSIEWASSFMNKFSSIMSTIQFRELHISCAKLSFDIFVRILELIPHLELLDVSFLPVRQWSNLSEEDLEQLHCISNKNKIVKVRLWMDLELLQFLMNMCPRMEYLEVRWIEEKDLEMLIRTILTKSSSCIRRLHSLQCHVLNGTDKLIETIQRMINTEKILSDHTILRCENKISLHWKVHS
ncbi:hypothetical protein I4U23_003347 [Adineta vaga]|nr:hypothetical protein I4U23_003347 [Adineta vaga]